MKTPVFLRNQFVDEILLNGAAGKTAGGIEDLAATLFGPGIFYPDVASVSPTGLVASIDLPLPFRVLFLDGTLASAHGTTTGQDTQSYSVDFTSQVPGSGSVTAYLLLQQSSVSQDPVQVIGPPPGHPDFNPGFVPYTGYTSSRDTLSLVASTTAPDNESTFELFRCTLAAGATGLGTLDFSNQRRAGAYSGFAVAPVSGSVLLSPSNAAATYFATAAATFTLPFADDSNGLCFTFVASPNTGVGDVTVQADGEDLIFGYGADQSVGYGSVPLYPGASIKVGCLNGEWQIVGGSHQPQSFGVSNIITFVTPGNQIWTVPFGVTRVFVEVWGGGGGGCGGVRNGAAGASGAGGGYSAGFFNVTPGQQTTITVGAGGAGTAYPTPAVDGGTSSFGSFCSATGGTGGSGGPGNGGIGSGGQINMRGGAGTDLDGIIPTAPGGAAPRGGAGATENTVAGLVLQATQPGGGGGASGNDAFPTSNAGSAGAGGMVIVYT